MDLERLRKEVRKRLDAKKKEQERLIEPDPLPLYDEVFWKGLHEIDNDFDDLNLYRMPFVKYIWREKVMDNKFKKYRKKPVIIEAIQWDGEKETFKIIQDTIPRQVKMDKDGNLIISTLEGDHKALPRDYIIIGVKGEAYPCKPDIFRETYEEVEGL